MGLRDLVGKITGKKEEKAEEKKPEKKKPEGIPLTGKYAEECALCGNPGTDKKWMGQYWHRKCLKKVKRGASKMV